VANTTANHKAAAQVDLKGPENIVGDNGHHSNDTLAKLRKWEIRNYLSERQRGRRCWQNLNLDPKSSDFVHLSLAWYAW
jgi:hypothetical protein